MKKFDLEAAKAGAQVVTRDGKKVRILCFDRKTTTYPIIGLVLYESSNEEVLTTFDECGLASLNGIASSEDLFMAPQKKEYWVNVYKDSLDIVEAGQCHDSEAGAIYAKACHRTYLTTVKIYEEEV